MFDALNSANFSPIEMLIAAALIVLVLLVPWWLSAAIAAGLVALAAARIRAEKHANKE